jgi:hypothetical protein
VADRPGEIHCSIRHQPVICSQNRQRAGIASWPASTKVACRAGPHDRARGRDDH